MRFLIPFFIAHVAFAHPDHEMLPGSESQTVIHTGSGAWSYDAVPHWGELPDGKIIGPTHGGVVVDDVSGLIYVSTDSELSVIVYQTDGGFLRAIAPECRGFHAMAIRYENTKPVIYGAQLNSKDLRNLQKTLIHNWIQQGVKYEQHWAFNPVEKVLVP